MNILRKLLSAAFPDSAWEVDLHGMRVPEALETVEAAIKTLQERGGGRVRLITGKGRHSPGGVGVLRQAVAGWLEAHGHEAGYTRRVEADGRDGSILLEVKSEGE